jgi:mono/diheme cytochrome c family protein
MKSIVSFLGGIIFTLLALAGVGYFGVKAGIVPANADSKPGALESWVANTALDATLERGIKDLKNPIQANDESLITGMHLYAENCAICHGASDAKPSNLAQGFYIDAPQLAKDGVEDDPEAASFWKVKHGIRFTAMPSFTKTLQRSGKSRCSSNRWINSRPQSMPSGGKYLALRPLRHGNSAKQVCA